MFAVVKEFINLNFWWIIFPEACCSSNKHIFHQVIPGPLAAGWFVIVRKRIDVEYAHEDTLTNYVNWDNM